MHSLNTIILGLNYFNVVNEQIVLITRGITAEAEIELSPTWDRQVNRRETPDTVEN